MVPKEQHPMKKSVMRRLERLESQMRRAEKAPLLIVVNFVDAIDGRPVEPTGEVDYVDLSGRRWRQLPDESEAAFKDRMLADRPRGSVYIVHSEPRSSADSVSTVGTVGGESTNAGAAAHPGRTDGPVSSGST